MSGERLQDPWSSGFQEVCYFSDTAGMWDQLVTYQISVSWFVDCNFHTSISILMVNILLSHMTNEH